jgi:5'-nucleotidase
MIPWNSIDTALLDMDGTLLDLYYDNFFWQRYVPERYAEKHGLATAAAANDLSRRYRRVEGTLDWYCVDYWTQELGLDITALKHEVRNLIAIHPHTVDFLEALRTLGKRRVLVTNAHGKALALKLECTGLRPYFNDVVCSHDLGVPKEHDDFWRRLQRIQPFDAKRTVLVDDSLPVLRSAKRYGIEHLVVITRPDSRCPERPADEFVGVASVRDLMPRIGS